MGGTCVADAIDMIHTIDKYYAQLFAYLVGRLDSFREGDAELLDNTATVWFQEMSDGNSHNLNNLPILQAGSCGGYFKTGWAVNVEGGTADMTAGQQRRRLRERAVRRPTARQRRDPGRPSPRSRSTSTSAT